MLEKINCTPHLSDFGVCLDKDGQDIAVAVLKATYLFDAKGNVTEAEEDQRLPVFKIDQHYDKPENSSVQYASDFVPEKIGTDITVNGSVYGWNRTFVAAGFSVNHLKKEILACGERRMDTFFMATIKHARPFNKLPLRYERAYGGSYKNKEGHTVTYPYNPVGLGFAEAAADGMLLPFFEYKNNSFKNIESRPYPAGLGFIPVHWQQRYRFAGTYDQKWQDERRPLFPEDFDVRFYNAVSPDQVYLPKIAGGEKVTLFHLHPQAQTVELLMPSAKYVCTFKIKDESRAVPMVKDTVLFEPDQGRFSLTYRASTPVGNDFRLIRAIIFKEG